MTKPFPLLERRPVGRTGRARGEGKPVQRLKILPWFARRHGVPLERAEELWRQSLALADFEHGTNARTPEYWAHAIRVLLRLLRCEGVALVQADDEREQPLAPPAARSAVLLIDSQRRLGAAAFDAAEAFVHAANEYWSRALRVVNARR